MATEGPKSLATFFLFINLLIYAILVAVAGWALNYGIVETPQSRLSVPARLFPVYYPIGNFATGFFVVFALIAGLVGVAASLTGLQSVVQGNSSGLLSAASSSVVAWGLTVLAMGLERAVLGGWSATWMVWLACKEISIGWRTAGLRTLETLTIIVSGTQLLCTGAIHASITSTISQSHLTGRV